MSIASKIFFIFFFLCLLLTTEAMGIWWFAGAFAVRQLTDKVNAGAKPC